MTVSSRATEGSRGIYYANRVTGYGHITVDPSTPLTVRSG
jgi:hypothetical protein